MKVFGTFRLDTGNHCLWRGDERAALTPKAFDVLRYLVEHADRLVTHDELLEALWPETYVNPEGIRKYILEIRKVLGDRSGHPAFIETLPKRGYQFVAPVTDDRKVTGLDPAAQPFGNMVGRREGLARLDGYLQEALAGQRRIVFVTGEGGIGKTTLVDAFQQQAVRRGDLRIARGQCIEGFGGIEAYYPMLEALGSLLNGSEVSALVQTLAKRAPTWLIQFPALIKPEQRESLQREILGSTRERMVRELCEALEAITAQTPLIVILEDLHWADPSTLDLISAVARRREPAKFLLIGTYRPVDVVLSQSPLKALKQDLLVRSLCHEIAIERLEESDVDDYLAKIFSTESLPSGLANLIHQHSGGNPLFMTAIAQDMVSKGFIAEDQGRWILTAPLQQINPDIPETLQRMLEIQIERLTLEEQRILQSGSVAGERFSVWSAAAMLDANPASIEEACERLAKRQQFIRSIGVQDAPNGTASAHFEFRHALYRQALYRSLSGMNRSELHRQLAEQLMPICMAGKPEMASELALHFEQGRDYQRATQFLMLAAENAAKRFSRRDAIRILQHALEIVPTTGPGAELEIQVLQGIGDTQFVLGEMSNSVVSYEAAAARAAKAGLHTAHVGALVRLGFPVWFLDSIRGNQVSQQALDGSKSLDDPLLAARTQLAVAGIRLLNDEWREEDAQIFRRAQDTITRLTGSSIHQDVYAAYVQSFFGAYEEARRQADALIGATTNPRVYVLGIGAIGLISMFSGRFGEMFRMIQEGRTSAEKNGEYPWMFLLGEAWIRTACFDYDGARRLSTITVPSDAPPHAVWLHTAARIASGYAELYQGNHGEAMRYFAEIRDFQITPKFFIHWHWRLWAALGTAEAWLSAGNLGNARHEVDGCLQSALSTPEPNMRALAWELKSRVATAEQDFESARQHIDNALDIVEHFGIAAAWRVHATACDLCQLEKDDKQAARHHAIAYELIMGVADSFEEGEPLLESFLTAPPVRRILGHRASA